MVAAYRSTRRGVNAGASRASAVKLVATTSEENEAGIPQSRQITYGRFLSAGMGRVSLKFAVGRHELSSQAGASSTKDDDDDLEIHGSNDESDADLSDGDEDGEKPHDELELSDAEIDPTKKKSQARWTQLKLFKVILNAPGLSVDSALSKWAGQGKELSRKEIFLAVRELRRRKMYGDRKSVV